MSRRRSAWSGWGGEICGDLGIAEEPRVARHQRHRRLWLRDGGRLAHARLPRAPRRCPPAARRSAADAGQARRDRHVPRRGLGPRDQPLGERRRRAERLRQHRALRARGLDPCWRYASRRRAARKKRIWMEHGQNTTYIAYTALQAREPLRLTARAIANNRVFHNTGTVAWPAGVSAASGGVRVVTAGDALPLFLKLEGGAATPATELYRGFALPAETARGSSIATTTSPSRPSRRPLLPGETVGVPRRRRRRHRRCRAGGPRAPPRARSGPPRRGAGRGRRARPPPPAGSHSSSSPPTSSSWTARRAPAAAPVRAPAVAPVRASSPGIPGSRTGAATR